MKLRTIFTAAALTALFAAAPVVAHAHDHDGDWDEHHEWQRTGGMTTIRAGSTIIIRNGSRHTLPGAHTMAIGMTIMSGATAIGGMTIIQNGFANIIMTGTDGVTSEI